MDLSHIYVHDGRLLRITEDTETDVLTLDVELPVSEWSEDLEAKRMVFEEVHDYQVHEALISGCPTILDISVLSKKGHWWQVRLDTNAGYREWYCSDFKLQPSKD